MASNAGNVSIWWRHHELWIVSAQESGLSEWAGGHLAGLGSVPPGVLIFVICICVSFFTEFTTNTAVIAILLPVLMQMVSSGTLMAAMQVPVLLLRHDAVARILASGSAAFFKAVLPLAGILATASDRSCKTRPWIRFKKHKNIFTFSYHFSRYNWGTYLKSFPMEDKYKGAEGSFVWNFPRWFPKKSHMKYHLTMK